MKKKFLEFSNLLLSREQLKKVKGGYNSGGVFTCTAKCRTGPPVTCTSSESCSATDYDGYHIGVVRCGNYPNESYTPCNP